MEQPDLMKRAKDEIKRVLVDPFRNQNPEGEVKLWELLNYNTIEELSFFSNCFSESLRIQPPVAISSMCYLTEDTKIGPYTIRKGDPFIADMHHLHRDPK